MNLLNLFKRQQPKPAPSDPHATARERFEQAFAKFSAEIEATKSAHGRVNDARKAKREAVHAALAGGRQ